MHSGALSQNGLGRTLVPTASSFDERIHLARGDVAADDASPPASLRIRLKRSKCDQMGLVYVGRTGTEICPVSLTLQYVMERGPSRLPFLRLQVGIPLTKVFSSPKSAKPYLRWAFSPNATLGIVSGLALRRRQRRQDWRTPSYRDGVAQPFIAIFAHRGRTWPPSQDSWWRQNGDSRKSLPA